MASLPGSTGSRSIHLPSSGTCPRGEGVEERAGLGVVREGGDVGPQEAVGDRPGEQLLHRVPEATDVEQADRLGVDARAGSTSSPRTPPRGCRSRPGSTTKPSDRSAISALRSCIDSTTRRSVTPSCMISRRWRNRGITPMTSPPAGQHGVGDHAHQPDRAAAVDEADAPAHQLRRPAPRPPARRPDRLPRLDPQYTQTRFSSTGTADKGGRPARPKATERPHWRDAGPATRHPGRGPPGPLGPDRRGRVPLGRPGLARGRADRHRGTTWPTRLAAVLLVGGAACLTAGLTLLLRIDHRRLLSPPVVAVELRLRLRAAGPRRLGLRPATSAVARRGLAARRRDDRRPGRRTGSAAASPGSASGSGASSPPASATAPPPPRCR